MSLSVNFWRLGTKAVRVVSAEKMNPPRSALTESTQGLRRSSATEPTTQRLRSAGRGVLYL